MPVNNLVETFGLSQALDILHVSEGQKEASRIKVCRSYLPLLFDQIRQLGAQGAVGNYAIGAENNDTSYSEWCYYSLPTPDGAEHCHVYVAGSKKAAEQMRHLDEQGHEHEGGRMFGYPECCVQHWQQNARSYEGKDLLFETYNGFLQIPWQMNIAMAWFDRSLLSYYPCSPFCKASLAFANNRLEMLRRSDPAWAEMLEADLRLTTLIGARDLGCVAFSSEWTTEGLKVKKINYKTDSHSFLAGAIHENDLLTIEGSYYTLNGVSYKNDVLRLIIHD